MAKAPKSPSGVALNVPRPTTSRIPVGAPAAGQSPFPKPKLPPAAPAPVNNTPSLGPVGIENTTRRPASVSSQGGEDD